MPRTLHPVPAGTGRRPPAWPWERRDTVGTAALAAVALACRLVPVLASPGGLGGNLGDDAAAYYAGADALVHGRLPYRDFVLLHPPLLDLLLTPFAAAGTLVGDHAGFVAASLATVLVGVVNTMLVVLVGRRFGLDRTGAYVAGLLHAALFGAVITDAGIRLETWGNLFSLLGLLALPGPRPRHAVLAGFAFGAAASVKIWGALPAVIALAWWSAVPRHRRLAPSLAAGMACAVAVVCGPFFVVAPRAMYRMTITDQFTRLPDTTPRLPQLFGLAQVFPHLTGGALTAAVATVSVLGAGVLLAAMRVPGTRVVVVTAAAEVALLVIAPSYFIHYAGFAAPAFALAAGAAVAGRRAPTGVSLQAGRMCAVALVAAAVFETGVALVTVPPAIRSRPFPRDAVARAVGGTRCPATDGPMALIQIDRLSSSLADGCPNWVDVSGRVYDVDRSPHGPGYPRSRNGRWQRDLTRYLLDSDVVVLFRPGLGIGGELSARLGRRPLLVDRDGVVVRRVRVR